MKNVFMLMLSLSVLLSFPLSAHAHDVPQEREDCGIEVIVRYDGEDVNGGTLTAIQVGYVDEEDGNYFFSQEMTGEKLDDVASPEAAQALKKFYDNSKGSHEFYTQTQAVKQGKAVFSDLPTGLYLIVQNRAAEGFSKLESFLVGVPMMVEGAYQYHVSAAVKSELEREPEPAPPPSTHPSDPKLPQTGQLNWPVPRLAVSGMALILVGRLLSKKEHEA
ncbi:MAG: hypothetical protein IJD21_07910 [Oscillospiraceae bacterium]|nr:hypothetical protein [Oscillospiraceae bacterium]